VVALSLRPSSPIAVLTTYYIHLKQHLRTYR